MNNSDLFPNLRTYRDAYIHWAAVKPYSKGASKGLKPLGGNRRYDRSLIRQDDNDIVCSLYDTDVIRYKPDNTIELWHGGFETISTAEIMDLVLRYRFGHENNGRLIARVNSKLYVVDGTGFKHRFDDSNLDPRPIVIRPDNSVEGGITEYKHNLIKPVMAQMRKHYAEFVEYMTFYAQSVGNNLDFGASKVPHLPTTVSELRWNKHHLMQQREGFFGELNELISGDPLVSKEAKLEKFYELSKAIAYNAKDARWEGYTRQHFVTPKAMREHFYELCRYEYNEHLFEEVAAERGKVVRDENEKYVALGSDASLPWTC